MQRTTIFFDFHQINSKQCLLLFPAIKSKSLFSSLPPSSLFQCVVTCQRLCMNGCNIYLCCCCCCFTGPGNFIHLIKQLQCSYQLHSNPVTLLCSLESSLITLVDSLVIDYWPTMRQWKPTTDGVLLKMTCTESLYHVVGSLCFARSRGRTVAASASSSRSRCSASHCIQATFSCIRAHS